MSHKRRDKDYLGDIIEAIELLVEYTKGLTYQKFLNERKTQDAVVRNFQVVGEASKKVSKKLKEKYPDIPWKQMAGLRDKLIHFYFGIDYAVVWNVVKKELPNVLKEIRGIIRKEEG